MKVSQLRQLIREEISKVLKEDDANQATYRVWKVTAPDGKTAYANMNAATTPNKDVMLNQAAGAQHAQWPTALGITNANKKDYSVELKGEGSQEEMAQLVTKLRSNDPNSVNVNAGAVDQNSKMVSIPRQYVLKKGNVYLIKATYLDSYKDKKKAIQGVLKPVSGGAWYETNATNIHIVKPVS